MRMLAARRLLLPRGGARASLTGMTASRAGTAVPAASNAAVRSFASGMGQARDPAYHLNKRAVNTCLVFAAGMAGGYFYLTRERPEVKEIERLTRLANMHAVQGEMEESVKYTVQAFNLTKAKLPDDPNLVSLALSVGGSFDSVDQSETAIAYYFEALNMLPNEKHEATRELLSITILDKIATCYHKKRGDPIKAEEFFKKAITAYYQYSGQRALSQPSEEDEVARLRQQLLTVANSSAVLKKQAPNLERQFDEFVEREKQRKEQFANGDHHRDSKDKHAHDFSS